MSEVIQRMIEHERAYQIDSGNADEDETHDIYDWYQILEYYLSAGKKNALASIAKNNDKAHAQASANLRKIAAVAMAAMEHLGCPEREGYELRPNDGNQAAT